GARRGRPPCPGAARTTRGARSAFRAGRTARRGVLRCFAYVGDTAFEAEDIRKRRDDAIERLAARPFDLLVIGGGIVGAGIAEAATAHGLDVALVDRGDFGGATSSSSSKLIHGGLRYLRLGDVGLVREAHRERRLLTTVVAPHLVRRLP